VKLRATSFLLTLVIAAGAGGGTRRRVAVTFDDLPGNDVTPCNAGALRDLNQKLVAAIHRNNMPAIGFVNEGRLCAEKRNQIPSLLTIWLDAGLELGNHTYSHIDFNTASISGFEKNIIDGEKVTRPLLASRGKTLRYFRFPFLHMGKNLTRKHAIEHFLSNHGYENAVVTIDDDDSIYAVAYASAGAPAKKRLADDYIRYMESMFAFYEKWSRDIAGYEPPQILLLHDHQLNADTLDRLAAMIRHRGYSFISIAEALRDPVYQRPEHYTGGHGLSWMYRWAFAAGKKAPGQAGVPPWVMDLFHAAGH